MPLNINKLTTENILLILATIELFSIKPIKKSDFSSKIKSKNRFFLAYFSSFCIFDVKNSTKSLENTSKN